MRTPKLTDEAIQTALTELPEWRIEDGMLTRTFTFRDFVTAIQFVVAVSIKAEIADHHPDLDIRYNKVKVGLVTHDSGGLTVNDVNLAKEISTL
jgi:4a-hydroxytetrahydrobiopterin dehydratase